MTEKDNMKGKNDERRTDDGCLTSELCKFSSPMGKLVFIPILFWKLKLRFNFSIIVQKWVAHDIVLQNLGPVVRKL